MRDKTARRNYSAEAEEFGREHHRRREWGLAQRHARKLTRLYGSTANAAAAFQRRAEELTSRPAAARTATPARCEPARPEPSTSAPAPPRTAAPEAIELMPIGPEPIEPESIGPESEAEPSSVNGLKEPHGR